MARPVIVVGNITVGGSGKTPAGHLAGAAAGRARASRPAWCCAAMAGPRQPAASPCLVTPDSDPAVVGDEALLLRLRTGVPVVVGRDRVRGRPAAARSRSWT